ncbi:MAG: formyltransferase family protein [Promethearchaeota archaeon]
MNILFLSPHKHLIEFIESFGDEVIQTVDPLTDKILNEIDFIVSYGYRHIIKKPILDKFKGRAINLHISYLPWNRGADPNLWSFLEDTPKGVTIHYLDDGIDTGDIIAQTKIKIYEDDTLKTTYQRLSETMENLFKAYWSDIRKKNIQSMPQLTYHKSKDKIKYQNFLIKGWDTPIKDIIGKVKER